MINVKIVSQHEKICAKDLHSCKFYSCKKELTKESRVFFIVPPIGDYCGTGKKIVIWVSSLYSGAGLGYDFFPILEENYCDFREIKDAELTFYV